MPTHDQFFEPTIPSGGTFQNRCACEIQDVEDLLRRVFALGIDVGHREERAHPDAPGVAQVSDSVVGKVVSVTAARSIRLGSGR